MQIEALNQELAAQGFRQGQIEVDSNRELSRFVKRLTEEQFENLSEVYGQSAQELEQSIKQLQRKRNALPWEEVKQEAQGTI
jgi:hypothetical protein